MSLPGGGSHRLAPGQITDDGEMSICLGRGLAQCENGKFEIEKIAKEYAAWVESVPFDMGITIGASIGCLLKGARNSAFQKHLKEIGYAQAMKNAAKFENSLSKSNGSLMRCHTIAIYGHQLTDDEIALLAREDSSLSHPNPTIADSTASYCIAMADLIMRGAPKDAFSRAKAWADAKACAEVKEWLHGAETDSSIQFHPNGGFAKVAFVEAFKHLLKGSSFTDAVRDTLVGGGDTDTNCCIVAALTGAARGLSDIPVFMQKAVLLCDTQKGRPRPEFLHARQIPELVAKLMKIAPVKLEA